jgi:parallel beta-helix repeat protein
MEGILLKHIAITLILFISIILSSFLVLPQLLGAKYYVNFNIYKTNKIHYVGGNGLFNFSSIQDAINHADIGDKIFVYNGIYYENIKIKKNYIFLIGQEKNNTIIDGNNTGDIISILANNITISNFTIQNCGNTPMYDAGLEINSNYNKIINNIIRYNGEFGVGIFLNESLNNIIIDNTIYKNGNEGIYLENSKNNYVSNNKIYSNGHCSIVISNSRNNTIINNFINNNHCGISLWPNSVNNKILNNIINDHLGCGIGIWTNSNNNYIKNNSIFNNSIFGIGIFSAQKNIIEYNYVYGSFKGITIYFSFYNKIYFNDFINNIKNAYINNSFENIWHRNFWDDHTKFLPKIIPSDIYIHLKSTIIYLKWFNIDFFPSINPNTILSLSYE